MVCAEYIQVIQHDLIIVAPAEFESDVYASCGQTSCRICVQELDLTDDIESYTIQVCRIYLFDVYW